MSEYYDVKVQCSRYEAVLIDVFHYIPTVLVAPIVSKFVSINAQSDSELQPCVGSIAFMFHRRISDEELDKIKSIASKFDVGLFYSRDIYSVFQFSYGNLRVLLDVPKLRNMFKLCGIEIQFKYIRVSLDVAPEALNILGKKLYD